MDQVVQVAKDQVAVFTAPDKGDRALQFLYGQLPYHPERIEKGTMWTVELTQPLTVAKATPAAANLHPAGDAVGASDTDGPVEDARRHRITTEHRIREDGRFTSGSRAPAPLRFGT